MGVVLDELGAAVLDELGGQVSDDGVTSFAYLNEFIGANGSIPADFTTSETVGTGGTFDVQTNQLRLLTSATNFHTLRMVLPTSNWLRSDGALVLSYQAVTGLGQMNLILRGSGAWSSDMPTNGYILFLNMAGAGFELYRVNSSVATQVGTTQSYVWSTGVFYFTRFFTLGANLKVKIWLTTDVEPEAWTYEVTDGSPYLTAGQFQMTYRTVDSAIRDLRVGDVGIQTLPIAFAPRGTGTANNATTTTTGSAASANAVVAAGVGAAEFDGDDSDSINLEIYAATPGSGAAYNATVTTMGVTNVSAQSLSKTGTANNPSVTRTGQSAATVASGVGAALLPNISATTGTTNAPATLAAGDGDAGGIGFLLDENGDPILDEIGEPLEDGASLTIKVSLSSGVATSAGASNTPSRSVAPHAGLAAVVGIAVNPSVNTSGAATTTNVNPTAATSTGTANAASTLISPASGAATGTGAAHLPTITAPVVAATAESVGATYDLRPHSQSVEATGSGEAPNAQVNVDGSNFVSLAPIPISGTAADAQIGLSVYPDEITVTGSAGAVSSTLPDPGQLITVRDHGHTVSLKER